MIPLPNKDSINGKFADSKEEYLKKFEKYAKKHEILLDILDSRIRNISPSDIINVDYSQIHDTGKSKYQKIVYSVRSQPFVWIIVQDNNLRMSVSLYYSDLDAEDKSIWRNNDSEFGKNRKGLGPEISFNDASIDVMRAIVQAFTKQKEGTAPTRTTNSPGA